MPESSNKVRVGVVGVGSIATYMHLPALSAIENAAIVALCDPNEYLLARSGEKYGVVSLHADYKEMLGRISLDAVILCLPPMFHVEAARFFLSNGIHVLCEKPVGLDEEQAREVLALARDKQLVLHAGYHNRFLKTFSRARSLFQSGSVGRFLQFNLSATLGGPNLSWEPKSGWYHSREAGGVTFDAGSHMFDLLHYVTGEEVVKASVQTAVSDSNNELPDQVAISVKTRNGVVGTVNIGWGGRTAIQSLTIYGTDGHFMATPTAVTYRSPKHNKITDIFEYLGSAFALAKGIFYLKIKSGPPPQYQLQMERFIDAVRAPVATEETARVDNNIFEVLSGLRHVQSEIIKEVNNK